MLPPALLSVVGLLHVHMVLAAGMSPWKGGGFGMFSTIESPASRVVRLHLVGPTERIPVLVPGELADLVAEIQTLPRRQRLDELARRAAVGAWVPYRLLPATEHYRVLRQRHDSAGAERRPWRGDLSVDVYSLENAAYLGLMFDRLRFLRMVPDDGGVGSALRFDHVEAEVWQLEYDSEGRRLRLRLVDRVAARRHE
jgi:YD repeat-containing protein